MYKKIIPLIFGILFTLQVNSQTCPSTPTLILSSNPSSISSGGTTTVMWMSQNATSCTASGGWTGSKALSGTQNIKLFNSTTFNLTCKNSLNQQVQKSVVVTVTTPTPVPTLTLTASPTTIDNGQSTQLSWSSANTTSCTASGGWSGTREVSGTEQSGSLTTNTSFTLSCTGAGGNVSKTASINVNAPAPVGSVVYSTNFDLNEFPISEGGVWHKTPNVFTDVRSQNGVAYSSSTGTSYDDSYALLSGFGPNQTIEAEIVRNTITNFDASHEAEILLRFIQTSIGAKGIEVLFSYYGGIQAIKWKGIGNSGDNFEVLSANSGTERYFRQLQTGDKIKASFIQNTIFVYINDVLLGVYTENTIVDGQPGVGFFIREESNPLGLVITSYKATSE